MFRGYQKGANFVRCPKCGLENPPNTSWCDCGYDFGAGKVDQSHIQEALHHQTEPSLGYFSFRKMISPSLIKAIYVVGMIAIVLIAVYFVFNGKNATNDVATLTKVVAALLLATAGELVWRIVCEQAIVLFSIHEMLASIDQSLRKR
jgi:hypothetical protein